MWRPNLHFASPYVCYANCDQIIIFLNASQSKKSNYNISDFININSPPSVGVKCCENPVEFIFRSVQFIDTISLNKHCKIYKLRCERRPNLQNVCLKFFEKCLYLQWYGLLSSRLTNTIGFVRIIHHMYQPIPNWLI